MNKYKLINNKTGKETICNKIIIDGFHYYVSDKKSKCNDWCYYSKDSESPIKYQRGEYLTNGVKSPKVLATNNPNIDIPKVVDEVEKLAHTYFAEERFKWEQENPNGIKSPQSLIEHYNKTFTPLYKAGYNKCEETFGNSDEDMIDFLKFSKLHFIHYGATEEELLKIWKEQRPIKVYYE